MAFFFASRPEEQSSGGFAFLKRVPQVQRAQRPEDTRSNLEKGVDFLFGGLRKTVEAIESLTGKTDRELKQIEEDLKSGKISNEEAQRRRQRFLQDTEFAGMKDEDRARKALGVAIEGALDVPFVGTLAKAGTKAAANVAKGGGLSVARQAIRGGTEGAVVGGIAGGGISAQGDDRTAEDILTGAGVGTLFGGALGATLPIAIDSAGNAIKKLKSGELQLGASTKKVEPTKGAIDEIGQLNPAAIVPEAPTEAKLSVASRAQTTDNFVSKVDDGFADTADKVMDGEETLKLFEQTAPGVEVPTGLRKYFTDNPETLVPKTRNRLFKEIRDPIAFLSERLGRQGADIVYDLAGRYKKMADVYEHLSPALRKLDKSYKKIASTQAGKKDIGNRVRQALEDRANAQTYLTTGNAAKDAALRDIYEDTVKIYDFFKPLLLREGYGVQENYAPRVLKQVFSESDAMESTFQRSVANTMDVDTGFVKPRKADEIPDAIFENPIELIPKYVSAVTKNLAFKGFDDDLNKLLKEVNPALYKANRQNWREAGDYLGLMIKDIVAPGTVTKTERRLLQGLSNTYKSSLFGNVRLAFQNRTQRNIARSQVSKQAKGLSKKLKDSIDEYENKILGGLHPITEEASEFAQPGKFQQLGKFEPFSASERGNVSDAFRLGVAEHLTKSPIYKQSIKNGMSPQDAFKAVMADPVERDLAIRSGNIVNNMTNFSANKAFKPEVFRKNSPFMKFITQYKRFQAGMTEYIGKTLKPKDARALDILARGNPAETPIVDYSRAVDSFVDASKEIVQAAKKGELPDVTGKEAEAFLTNLTKLQKQLNKQMQTVSSVKGRKNVTALAKMWATASLIQFLFDGGRDFAQSVRYAAPINDPTRGDPIGSVTSPASSPFSPFGGLQEDKLSNFVPVVGPVVNRARDLNRLLGGE